MFTFLHHPPQFALVVSLGNASSLRQPTKSMGNENTLDKATPFAKKNLVGSIPDFANQHSNLSYRESDSDTSSSSFSGEEDIKLINNMLDKQIPFAKRHLVASSSKSNRDVNLLLIGCLWFTAPRRLVKPYRLNLWLKMLWILAHYALLPTLHSLKQSCHQRLKRFSDRIQSSPLP